MTTNSEDWTAVLDQMSDAYVAALDRNVEASASLVETWADAVENSIEEDLATDAVESYARAYEVWMDAADEAADRVDDAAAGEEVSPEDFRDLWLEAANDAFSEVMGTEAFAAATGQAIEDALDVRQQIDDATEEALHAQGFATESDVLEVGERLVELERRQQRVEEKLDCVLDELA